MSTKTLTAIERVENALGALSLEMIESDEMQVLTEIGACLLIINNIKTNML